MQYLDYEEKGEEIYMTSSNGSQFVLSPGTDGSFYIRVLNGTVSVKPVYSNSVQVVTHPDKLIASPASEAETGAGSDAEASP